MVVAVEATGLCRSDWHGWMGHDADIALPHVPGHELAGTVVETGASVTRWEPGDRVTTPFVLACGRCRACARGDGQVCEDQLQPGFTQWGSFADLVALPRADLNLVRVPDEVPADVAAGLGCRFATAYRAVAHVGRVRAGETVVVHGCGGVGLSAVLVAAALGARVLAVDPDPASLALAAAARCRAAGDRPTSPTSPTAVPTSPSTRYGSPETLAAASPALRPRGRHVQVGLLGGPDASPPVDMGRVLGLELQLLGSHGMPASDYPELLARVADGTLDPGRLLRDRIGLAEAGPRLAALGPRRRGGRDHRHPARSRLTRSWTAPQIRSATSGGVRSNSHSRVPPWGYASGSRPIRLGSRRPADVAVRAVVSFKGMGAALSAVALAAAVLVMPQPAGAPDRARGPVVDVVHIGPVRGRLWQVAPGRERLLRRQRCEERSRGVGSKFKSSKQLQVTGVRIYRADPASIQGSLWTSDGTLLARGTFADKTDNGWQDLSFADPVTILPGQTYIASYFTPATKYAFQYRYFSDEARTVGPVTALKALDGSPNGVHCYEDADCTFPDRAYRDSTYWVTPLWVGAHDDPTPPAGDEKGPPRVAATPREPPAPTGSRRERASLSGSPSRYAAAPSTARRSGCCARAVPDPSASCCTTRCAGGASCSTRDSHCFAARR